MVIQNMFVEDINRKINGVVKVDEDENKVLEQELNEYVITRELKRHFADFFNTYAEAFDEPTADTGVWISGFFGSGKSHFLKMLSYLLENKEVNGVRTVERFRKKFEDDPGTFMQVDRATKGETETILFNIDYEGSINKDKTAVLRVFAKVFYNHLGFFGSNLKVAMLEQYITQQGKMDEFCRLVEEKKGKPWAEVRKAFAFNGKVIKPALAEALDISEEDANNWFNDKSATELSVSQLVDDIPCFAFSITSQRFPKTETIRAEVRLLSSLPGGSGLTLFFAKDPERSIVYGTTCYPWRDHGRLCAGSHGPAALCFQLWHPHCGGREQHCHWRRNAGEHPGVPQGGLPWRGPCQQPDAEGQGRRPRLGCLRGIRAHAAYKSQRRINRRNSKTAHPKR